MWFLIHFELLDVLWCSFSLAFVLHDHSKLTLIQDHTEQQMVEVFFFFSPRYCYSSHDSQKYDGPILTSRRDQDEIWLGKLGQKVVRQNSVHPSRAPPYKHMRRRNTLLTCAVLHDSIFRRTVLSKSCTVSVFEIKAKVTQPDCRIRPSRRSCKLSSALYLICRRWHSPDSLSTPALVFLVRFHACCRFSSRSFGINLACFTFAFSPERCAVWLLP